MDSMEGVDDPPELEGLKEAPDVAPVMQPDIVETLRKVCADAEAGKIRAVAIAYLGIEGNVASRYEFDTPGSLGHLIGIVEWLKYRMVSFFSEA